ncbi:gliding motility-associated ABC transporter substrate-binding protein GldG [Flavobacteriaceae bacterium F08102]|nr:gliding motility-associated ABC transporter substrate-binding protein GldG [Flavobacteriaceae bacterium F08102]
MKKLILNSLLVLVALIAVNVLAKKFRFRFDLTQDKRYSLSDLSKSSLKAIEDDAVIKVYLEGDFPAEFNRLQSETKQFLTNIASLNSHIKYQFIDPINLTETLIKEGLQPSRLTVQENGVNSELIIFPWATIQYKGKKEIISLLSNDASNGQEGQLENSIAELEYEFTNAIRKVSTERTEKIAILKGNGELDDQYLASFLSDLGQFYKLAPFTLDSVATNPIKTAQELNQFDLAIIAKPTEKFSEAEKLTLDQFIMKGGKTLWLLDNTIAELDSLVTGSSLAMNRDLNLTDQLFTYQVRLNYNLVRDMYAGSIRLADGKLGNQIQYQDYPWHYYPMITTMNNHPINKNVDPVLLKFANTIDTLRGDIRKTVLLQSSKFSKPRGTPFLLSLNEVDTKPIPTDYNNGYQTLGVLLQGAFTSAYANRVKPYNYPSFVSKGVPSKMIVIADGDIIANEVYQGQPLPLSIDKFTRESYGNTTFLLNAVNYLLDDGLLELRGKKLNLRFLDKKKAFAERSYWQSLNVVLPLLILGVLGFSFSLIRKRIYR